MKTKPQFDPLATSRAATQHALSQTATLDGLRDAIRRGGEAGLEPLVWTIVLGGATSAIENITHGTAKARALYDAWCTVLGAEHIKDFPTNEAGDTNSAARVRLADPEGLVLVLVLKLTLYGHVIEREQAAAAANQTNQEGA